MRLFRQLVTQHNAKVNDVMMRSLSKYRLDRFERYIDAAFRSAARNFPEGLEYLGYERCSPLEEYTEATRLRGNRRIASLAKSDLYLCKYLFRYNGVDLPPKYLYLPFVRDSGILYLGGPCFHITPVLSDRVISVGFDSVFVRLLKDKLTFQRSYHAYEADGRRETVHVVWSNIYRRKSKRLVAATTKADTLLLHYVLAKMGYSQAMMRLLGFVPLVSEVGFDRKDYPSSEWVICRSTRIKPSGYIGAYYQPSSLEVAIPRSQWNLKTKNVIGSFFYLVDHFPQRITVSGLDNTALWMILLGHIIFSGNYTEGKLYESVKEHFSSLEGYVDDIIHHKLEDLGYRVEDFYGLLMLVMEKFDEWLIKAQKSINSVYNKELEVDYYVGFPITSGIFKFGFNLSKLVARRHAAGKEVTDKDIIKLMNENIKMGAIYKVRASNIAVAALNYSGDNMYPKTTAIISEQESLPGPKRGRQKRKVPDVTRRFHTSFVEIGSLLYITKSKPICFVRMNPYTSFDPDRELIVPRLYPEILERTQRMLEGEVPPHIPK